MKKLMKLAALVCCLSLLVFACGEDDDDNGDNGDNGNTDTVTGAFCDSTCDEDEDCDAIDGGECVDDFCEYPAGDNGEEADGCEDDSECVATFSGWTETCDAQDACDAPFVCAEYGEEGFCVTEAVEGTDCAIGEETELDLVGEEDTVMVCADTTSECHEDGYCTMCQEDADCDHAGADSCIDGMCGCASDDACEDVDNADTCFDGICGCSDDDVCEDDAQACRSF